MKYFFGLFVSLLFCLNSMGQNPVKFNLEFRVFYVNTIESKGILDSEFMYKPFYTNKYVTKLQKEVKVFLLNKNDTIYLKKDTSDLYTHTYFDPSDKIYYQFDGQTFKIPDFFSKKLSNHCEINVYIMDTLKPRNQLLTFLKTHHVIMERTYVYCKGEKIKKEFSVRESLKNIGFIYELNNIW